MLIPAIATGIGLFSFMLVFTAGRQELAGRLLLGLIAVLTFPHIVHAMAPEPQQWPTLLRSIMGSHAFLLGPLLFLFVCAKVDPSRRMTPIDLLHFLPFVISSAIQPFLPSHHDPASLTVLVPLIISVIGYGVVSLLRIQDSLPDPLYNYGVRIPVRGHSLQWMVGMTVLLWTAQVIIHGLLPHREGAFLRGLIIAGYTLVICYISILFLLSHQHRPLPSATPSEGKTASSKPPGRYERSGLKADQSAGLMQSIREWMTAESPYLDPDFSPSDLAGALNVPNYQISQVINQESGSNFYVFVNAYRIEHVIRELRDHPSGQTVNLLHLALNAGFNSKSTFNHAFKKATGLTPSDYYRLLQSESPAMAEGA